MKVAFLLPDFTLSGGAGIVVEHARQLSLHHGMEVVLVRTKPRRHRDWAYRGLEHVRTAEVAEVRDERFDVAVATWWETTWSLFELDAARYAYFLQLFENSHYPPGEPDAVGFQMTLGLPVRFLTAARWIRDFTEQLQPGNRSHYVRSGIDKSVFASPESISPALDGPLRVVIEGSLGLPRKGTPHALEAAGLMRAERHVTLVTPEPPETPDPRVDVHVGTLSHPQMASLFASSHVLLKLSRAEGMYGPPLEGFHMGCTVVTNPVTGHDDYIVHGENGLVVDWDDPVGTARALDLLARDRKLLHRLRLGALATAATWPTWEQASTFMAGALRAIAAEPPPEVRWSGLRMGGEIGYAIADAERRDLDVRGARAALKGLRSQRAIRAALEVRRIATPVLQKARGARRRLGR